MLRNPSSQVSAVRVAIGGMLTAALVGMGAAWACTPQAYSVAVDSGAPILPGSSVTVKGVTYTHKVINANNEADADPSVAPVPVEIHEGATAEDAQTGALVATATGPDYEVKIRLAGPGYYYFYSFARNSEGRLVKPSALAFKVEDPASRPVSQEPTPLAQPPAIPSNLTTPAVASNPPANAQPSTSSPVEPRPASSVVITPSVAKPAMRPTPAPASSSAPGSSSATVTPVLTPATPTVTPSVVQATPSVLVPSANDLWSGIDRSGRGPSLLDVPETSSSGAGLPIGAGLLGIGVLTLAGVGVVVGQARRSKATVSSASKR